MERIPARWDNVGKATVEVTSPYALGGVIDANHSLLHVRICWDNPTTFACVVGISSVHVCGNATVQNKGISGGGGNPPTTTDCVSEDNFTDDPSSHRHRRPAWQRGIPRSSP